MLLGLIFLLMSACQARSGPPYEIIYTLNKGTEAPSQERSSAAPKPRIALVAKGIDIPYFIYAGEGAKQAGNDLGVDVIYAGPKTAGASGQIQVIEELIRQKVDMIAVSAADPDKLLTVLRQARAAGIRVITWDADTQSSGREFFVNMADPETVGRHLMDLLAGAMGDKGSFAVMTGSESAANAGEWLRWIRIQQQEYYPAMKLVEVASIDEDPVKAKLAARRLLSAYPDLGGMIGISSVVPPAAAEALEEAGRQGKVKLTGLSNPLLMSPYLKRDTAQTATLWSPKKLGYLTIAMGNNLLNGIPPADGQNIPGVGKIRMSGNTVVMGEPLDFTKENVDEYDF